MAKPKRKPRAPKVVQSPPEPPAEVGGLGGSLDPSKPSDRQMILRASKERWPVSSTVREAVVKQTAEAMDMAMALRSPRDVAGCARVLAALEAQNQADEHLIDKNARLDAGKATENVLLIDDLGK